MDNQNHAYEIPRWVLLLLGALATGLVAVLAWGLMPHATPAADGPTPTPGPDEAVVDPSWRGQRLTDGAARALLSRGDTLWVASDVDGLLALVDGEVRAAFPGVQVAALWAEGEDVLAGYVAFAEPEPVTEIAGDNGVSATLDAPAFAPGAGEAGLARAALRPDGQDWTPLWTEMAVWGLARSDEGRYLSTNDGVYLLKGRQAHPLGLDETLCFGLLYDEADQALYAGTLGGIWRYRAGVWDLVLALPGQKALALARDDAGRLYAATAAGLYASADGAAWQRRGPETLLVAVLVTPDGRILAGGEQGLHEWVGGSLQLRVRFPTNALAWHDGALYAATGAGLWRFQEQTREGVER